MNLYQALQPKTRKKIPLKVWIITLIIVAICIGAFIVWRMIGPKVEYDMIKPIRGDIKSSISASGSLSPVNEVEIGSVISGLVLEVLVDENDEVKVGQVLARINPETINQQIAKFEAQLYSARAQLKASEQTLVDKKWNYDRLKELYEATNGSSPSRLELQNAKTSYTSARSDVEIKRASIAEIETSIQSAKIDLKNSEIVSPVDGIVLMRSVEVGQSVAASFQAPTLFKVAENLEEMQLYASISEADIGKVKEGQEVVFTVDAYPDRNFHAKVNRVNFGSGDGSSSSSSASSSSNIITYRAKIEVDNKSLLLRPDMSATADIIIAQAQNALLVPSSALYFDLNKSLQRAGMKKNTSSSNPMFAAAPTRPRPQKPQVDPKQKSQGKSSTLWILKNGNPESVNVRVGITDGTYAQILNGIDENTQIITGIKTK
ncbi:MULTISPECIES: efflux RND transporter periplasmic adaptor subunit [Helicobacter]|uniref:Efflux RND transporter periplasmic adaptor subunit n=2 Tax=Helicobacter typhlonius TaxID=76936 RepID=A0A099UFL5_9HELI|nr:MULTISPECIES: efflux RND transporter periplasmic adaptor subunit [Helicobacter]TLD78704.1 efflux RND transporter periplasmic adaptor subunit [Helicobacter typhlonius]TLD89494.1 efflux RND transporter periplasmic adaptor subunit [Helicobacter sp. MIT 03-1616]CUU40010.1 Macrolide-specific efflux protein MacA [Helicobacter typhlonius]